MLRISVAYPCTKQHRMVGATMCVIPPADCATLAVFSQLPCWRLGAWLRPVSRGNRHFTVGGGRLRQSGPRSEGRLLRQPALEGLKRSARMDTPRKIGRNKFRRGAATRRRYYREEGAAAFSYRG
ncbi:hypothetical protein F511_36660 [Dorcoceras hygrometricum]|uniref:Uncharacterized protein n=1 Tax=Dorcoceras hygrometricum TaxID=472368 RepID=A0A2Z7AR52_9LAMI|nr:hypothetical protein F511_36660 [Dorcoceras hygrometricum]